MLRPQLNITDLVEAIPALKQKTDLISSRKEEIIEATEVLLKYEGYIEREKLIAEKLQRLEHVALKGRIDYNLSSLYRLKPDKNSLKLIRTTLARQAEYQGFLQAM